jgi:hypothetical protein
MDCLSIYKRTSLLEMNEQTFKYIPPHEQMVDGNSQYGAQLKLKAELLQQQWKTQSII